MSDIPKQEAMNKEVWEGKGIKCLVFDRFIPLADINILLQSNIQGEMPGDS